ncbi:MAG TPA: FAD-dependent oxidoreductase [Myxococcota bacterium]|nr:FAD-dependent oxidoreductase [Myxococcota bacterium]
MSGSALARDAEVLVVGAGLAGLSAACAIASAGRSVTVLEARERVGGRTLGRVAGGATFDLGAQYIGAGQERLARLAASLAIEVAPTPHAGRKWLEIGERRGSYAGAVPPLPPLALLQLQLALRGLDRLARRVPGAEPWTARGAARLDASTVEDRFRRSWFLHRDAHALLRHTVRMTFGAEAEEMSLLSLMQYLATAGGFARMLAIENGSQQGYFVQGAQALSLGLAARLGDRVVLGAAVRRLEQSALGVEAQTDAGVVRAARALVAMPPLLAGRIEYAPALPAARTALTERFPMGAAIKCIAVYEKAFWRDDGFSGELISDGGPVGFALDATKPGGPPALVGFIEGAPARAWGARAPEARRLAVLGQLAGFLGPEALRPAEYLEQDWTAEPYTGGCSAGFATVGTLAPFGAALRAPVGRLHWAGSETAREYFGYMEGALESGERAAAELLVALEKEGA